MKLLIYTLVLVGIVAASPLFGSSDDSSESEESTTVAPTEYQREDSQESVETTVIAYRDSSSEDQSISTEETTVIEETPAPVDHNVRVDVAHRIDENRREDGSEERSEETEERREEREERREDEEETTTVNPPPELPTAMAQMMGQLEIRLIDENNTQTHVESVIEPPPLSPITPYIRDDEDHRETTPATAEQEGDSTADPNEISEQQQQSNAEYDAKWKKVEYVSDTVLNLEATTTATTGGGDDEVPTSSPDASLPSVPPTEEIPDTTTTLSPMDQVALQKIQSAIELGIAKKMPEGPFPDAVTDEDLPVIEGVSIDDEEDDPEPVEECLANRHQLADEVVHRMEKQVERLSKMVRKLGKQQSQYCTQAADETTDRQLFTDTYSQCPIWREEKIVHYYKLMRITYCADYGKWPNGHKMVRTYGQYLPLFETLYAFQKQ